MKPFYSRLLHGLASRLLRPFGLQVLMEGTIQVLLDELGEANRRCQEERERHIADPNELDRLSRANEEKP